MNDTELIPSELDEQKIDRISIALANDYYGVKVELNDYYQNLLKQLTDISGLPLLFKHFMICLSTPRPSGKLDKMRNTLHRIADLLPGVEYTQDDVGNVCLKKKGCKGYENATGVVIQCHMDMVCTKTDDCKFDFNNDPIEAYIDKSGKWLKARNTTLGADNGIGIAAGLALMEHPNLIHGPIELLITVDEETNMNGAEQLSKSPFLKNKILINVDEEEGEGICIGCAGGFDKEFTVNMNKNILTNKNTCDQYKVYSIKICGLRGGHTGVDINLGRANAIIILSRVLNYLVVDKQINIQLVDLCGGNAMNAIPSYSTCKVVIPKMLKNKFEESIQEYWLNYIMNEFKDIETNKMDYKIEDISNSFSFTDTAVCDIKSSNILVSLMMHLPNGVIRMSPSVNQLVQTSISFSMVDLKKDSKKAICKLFARSMSMNEMLQLNRKMNCLATLLGNNNGNALLEVSDAIGLFPAWQPQTTSKVLDICKTAHIALFKKETFVYAIHAGLECGIIKDRYPEMDCISIGPYITGAHSTDEKLEIKSVLTFYNWLIETVTRVAIQ